MSKRTLKCAGREFELPSVSPSIDAAYDSVYKQALETPPVQWLDFGTAVENFVLTAPSAKLMDDFFEAATGAWLFALERGLLFAAEGFWSSIVTAVTNAETKTTREVHKGSGYYYWACNALRREDDERGLLLMHEALVEDARAHNAPPPSWPTTSAAAVISLDAQRIGTHPANWWAGVQVGAIDEGLESQGSKLRTAELRTRMFLKSDPSHVFLFVHAHASLLRICRIRPEHRDNDFVARLALGHLFHIAVVVERLLHAKTGSNGLFAAQVEALSAKLGGNLKAPLPGGAPHSSDINAQQKADPGSVLEKLLRNQCTYGTTPVTNVDRPLCIGYVLRNVGGHHAGAPRIVAAQVDQLRREMLGLVASVVEMYY